MHLLRNKNIHSQNCTSGIKIRKAYWEQALRGHLLWAQSCSKRIICGNSFNAHINLVAQSFSRVRLWDPMDCSTPGFPVFHCLLEFAQTHVHWVSDAINPDSLMTEDGAEAERPWELSTATASSRQTWEFLPRLLVLASGPVVHHAARLLQWLCYVNMPLPLAGILGPAQAPPPPGSPHRPLRQAPHTQSPL